MQSCMSERVARVVITPTGNNEGRLMSGPHVLIAPGYSLL